MDNFIHSLWITFLRFCPKSSLHTLKNRLPNRPKTDQNIGPKHSSVAPQKQPYKLVCKTPITLPHFCAIRRSPHTTEIMNIPPGITTPTMLAQWAQSQPAQKPPTTPCAYCLRKPPNGKNFSPETLQDITSPEPPSTNNPHWDARNDSTTGISPHRSGPRKPASKKTGILMRKQTRAPRLSKTFGT